MPRLAAHWPPETFAMAQELQGRRLDALGYRKL
ncbi:hypothetical protein AK812_SmicGene48463, partial [Symbiodinium microadriaticum]